MDGWTVTAEAGWTSAFCRQSGKERSFTPRGQGSFNPLALHFAQPLPARPAACTGLNFRLPPEIAPDWRLFPPATEN